MRWFYFNECGFETEQESARSAANITFVHAARLLRTCDHSFTLAIKSLSSSSYNLSASFVMFIGFVAFTDILKIWNIRCAWVWSLRSCCSLVVGVWRSWRWAPLHQRVGHLRLCGRMSVGGGRFGGLSIDDGLVQRLLLREGGYRQQCVALVLLIHLEGLLSLDRQKR